jgi:hypothetical protein
VSQEPEEDDDLLPEYDFSGAVRGKYCERCRRAILDWVGKVDYYDDYDPKRLRDRKPSRRAAGPETPRGPATPNLAVGASARTGQEIRPRTDGRVSAASRPVPL